MLRFVCTLKFGFAASPLEINALPRRIIGFSIIKYVNVEMIAVTTTVVMYATTTSTADRLVK
jgi:hypothetical protein